MNIEKLSLHELKQGYQWNPETNAWECLTCNKQFEAGEVFSFDGWFFEARRTIQLHIAKAYDQMEQLLASKYSS